MSDYTRFFLTNQNQNFILNKELDKSQPSINGPAPALAPRRNTQLTFTNYIALVIIMLVARV